MDPALRAVPPGVGVRRQAQSLLCFLHIISVRRSRKAEVEVYES